MPCARPLLLACLVLAAGCASPSPGYLGVEPQRVVIEGTEIAVWRRGGQAQAIRLGGYARPGTHAILRARLLAAIEQATGCAVAAGRATGDSGVMEAPLLC